MKRAFLEAEKTGNRSTNLLKIGEVARRSGIGIEALRFYERSGLLNKPARTYSGYRVYDESILERLAFIKKAQALGFALDEIKRIIDEKRTGKRPCQEVREIVKQRLEELEERLAELQRYRSELTATLTDWDETGEADGHVCGLIENSQLDHAPTHSHGLQKKRKE